LEEWKDTYATLHRWTQIVGKIRMARSPWINHSWHVTLYLTARGLTTSPLWHGARTFQIDFDFIDHRLLIQSGEGAVRTIALRPRGDPLLRAAGPPASWRRAAPAGRRRPGGLLPRGQQLRVLARRWPGALPGLLLVRLPHAGRVRRRAGSSERCLLQPRPVRV